MIGTVYLFSLFPIYRGLDACDLAAAKEWRRGMRLWVRPFVTIRWAVKTPIYPNCEACGGLGHQTGCDACNNSGVDWSGVAR